MTVHNTGSKEILTSKDACNKIVKTMVCYKLVNTWGFNLTSLFFMCVMMYVS